MRSRLQRANRARAASGYTLVELIITMTIFLVVVTALTSAFVSGTNAETAANRRFSAQQNARLALDRLRREAHCASAVTAVTGTLPGPVSAIRLTLPGVCPTSGGSNTTVVWQTASLGTRRWALRRTNAAGVTVKVADWLTTGSVFTYYAQSANGRGRLRVEFPVNANPSDAAKDWRLRDDIVLRNTVRS